MAREVLGGGRNKGEVSGHVPHCNFYFCVASASSETVLSDVPILTLQHFGNMPH